MKNKRIILGITIVLMVVGFAAVSTTLYLSGNTNVTVKEEDFDVYFSDVYIDDVQILRTISSDRKTITYKTNEMTKQGETSVLDYEVTNASKQYDAEVSINCVPAEDEWIRVEASQSDEVIEARSKGVGKITVTLKKNPLEEKEITFTCTLKGNAIERESIKEEDIPSTETQTWEFDYTGSEQEFIVPRSGEYKIELWGASGETTTSYTFGPTAAYTSGIINLEKEKSLYLYVGEQSLRCTNYTECDRFAFNGGGKGGDFTGKRPARTSSGGGATDVRLKNGNWDDFEGLKSRIMVAGGSGSGHNLSVAAGGLTGYQGNDYTNGAGGTQVNGGKAAGNGATNGQFGIGGNGYASYPTSPNNNEGLGAGGGYYGGGGGYGGSNVFSPQNHAGSGGGGSSFISGHNGCDAIEESSTEENIIHTGQPNHYSGFIFTDTIMIDGAGYKWTNVKGEQVQMPKPDGTTYDLGVGHTGNGYAKITYLGE